MFHNARLKLTIWYLLIIMLISVFFSIFIYQILTRELERGFERLSARYSHEKSLNLQANFPVLLEPNFLEDAENRIRLNLIYINLVIFGISGLAGYFLAGKTLKPIGEMMKEQDRFITDASHELRTPLTALKSEIEIYLRGKNNSLSEANKIIKSNFEEVNNLQKLTDSLLQLELEEGSLNFETVSLKKSIDVAIKKINLFAKQKNIDIINKNQVEHTLTGNAQMLSQLFIILLENGIKYSNKNTTITIDIKETEKYLLINITDQGIGIAEKDISHIFDRFFRTDTSRSKNEVSGYGLGLSIAKKIIEVHNGTISVASKENVGSTFTVKIPITNNRFQ